MKIPTDKLKELREQTGAGIMACRNALVEAEIDMEKALQIIKDQSLFIVEKKKERATSQGLVEAYVHPGGRIGAMIELNCETDFVARTGEFKELAHNLAMQIAAMTPVYISAEDIPEGEDLDTQTVCLLHQSYIRDPNLIIQDIVNETVAKVGENIKISRFARFELGDK
ncbi:elongation factor Ts [Chloroflexota bacterium]